MYGSHSTAIESLPAEKFAYFKWRESWNGYEDIDSNFDDDHERRRELRITAADEMEWRRIKDFEFRIEF